MKSERTTGNYCVLGDKNKACELLVDTGTYLTYIPREIFKVKM